MSDHTAPAALVDGIPRDESFDATAALLREGYPFISRRCRRHGTDAFETRLALRRTVCMTGPEAAAAFYHPGRFTRRRAMPPTTLRLLQDRGSVQLLDGDAHRRRKHLFTAVLGPAGSAALADAVEAEWRRCVPAWAAMGELSLHEQVRGVLCRAACAWAGAPLAPREAIDRTRELGAMIDGAGSMGPVSWHALLLRSRTERWARRLVLRAREEDLDPPPESPLAAVARHRDADGEPLPVEVAAVELINLLRPTVAVARFVTFAAHALHTWPAERSRVRAGGGYERLLAHEVRRYYPFFPAIAGRVRTPFRWHGHRFEEGDAVLLDLYGTNRDPRTWDDPETFRPERFRGREPGPFEIVPQGGGDIRTGHRCPGEPATVDILGRAVRLLAAMQYRVPEQDLSIDLARMPALPASGFVVRDVRWAATDPSTREDAMSAQERRPEPRHDEDETLTPDEKADEASDESFPASDPPAFGPGGATPQHDEDEDEGRERA